MTVSALPILYSFRRCPYAMRARHALLVTGQQVEIREVVLRDKPPQLHEASQKATVPVLVLPDGSVIDESIDIIDWALEQADPAGWRPTARPRGSREGAARRGRSASRSLGEGGRVMVAQ